jgi:hypothetical protein
MSDDLSRLRELEERLNLAVSMDPEISNYQRVRGADALGAILGVLDQTREQYEASSEALVLMTELFVQASIERLRLLKKRAASPADASQ